MAKLFTTTVALATLVAGSATADETVDTRIGELTFQSGYPSQQTVDKLYDEMDFQRACQAYMWGIPAVGINEWRKAHFDVFKAKNGEMLSYLDFAEKLGILTPNYTTPYVGTFIDLQESGPIVIEIPPGLMAGMILDSWQRVLADLGVVGPDKGKGGKYLILPPGHAKVAPKGYYVVESPSRTVLGAVRLLGADKEKAIAELIPGIKTYTWSPKGTGTVMPVRRAGDKKWSQMPPRGMAYWESLNEVIQREPVMERDRLILAQLRFLDIEKDKPSSLTNAKRIFSNRRWWSAKPWPRRTLPTSVWSRRSGPVRTGSTRWSSPSTSGCRITISSTSGPRGSTKPSSSRRAC